MKKKFWTCILLSICMFIICSCGPSMDYREKQKQGFYPKTSDFPNTTWICNELDLRFSMLDYEENYMIGTYTVKDKTYRVVGTFHYSRLNFDFYSETQIYPSNQFLDTNEGGLLGYERFACGYVYTEYWYENEMINCALVNCQAVDGETFPSILTFYKTDTVLQKNTRWYAQEVAMYLDSFDDMSWYYRGKIEIDGQNCFVQAFEIGNANLFMLSIENGTINNLRSNTTSPLIIMHLDLMDDKIIGKITDDIGRRPEMFPYWLCTETTLTFYKDTKNIS